MLTPSSDLRCESTAGFRGRLNGVRARAHRLHGIVNGIDSALWNPATDPHLQHVYDGNTWQTAKPANKRGVRADFGLASRDDDAPLLGMIGRLTEQKGFDLLTAAADDLVSRGVQVAVLASPSERNLEDAVRRAATKHPGEFAVKVEFTGRID